MPEQSDFRFDFGSPDGARRQLDSPMRILVVGDFGGASLNETAPEPAPLADRPVRRLDIDNFDDVFRKIAPRVDLPASDDTPALTLSFSSLDDFHPDSLFDRVEIFQALRGTRERLADPSTFAETAAGLKQWAQSAPTAEENEPPPPAQTQTDDHLLDRLLGERPVQPRRKSVGGHNVDISGFIRGIVAPHIVSATDPQQALLISSVDDSISVQMRRVLHHPRFQRLEAAWRSLAGLINAVEIDESLSIHVLDVTRNELESDLAADNLQQSSLYRQLVERGVGTAGGQPFSFVVADLTFEPEPRGLMLLAALATVAAHAGGPLLAGGSSAIVGCRSLAQTPDPDDWVALDAQHQAAWRALRSGPIAPWIGLTLPRLLLRQPYGRRSDPVEHFDFEEIAGPPGHDQLLWGNAAFGCAALLAQSFTASGWSMSPGDDLKIMDLPAYVFDGDGGRALQPVAETLMSDRAGERILAQGPMPLLSVQGQNMAQLMRFQSVAEPAAALCGPWG